MKTKSIPLIIVATFAMAILFSQSFIVQPAYAQAFVIISPFNYGIKAMSYQASTDNVWVLSSLSAKTWLYQVDRATGSITLGINHTTNFATGGFGVAQDLWCGQTDCFITTNTGSSGCVVRISTENISPNIFVGQNITGSQCSPVSAGYFKIFGRDAVSGGFGSITLWIDGCSEAAATCDGQVRVIDGISMSIASTFTAYTSTNNFAIKTHEMAWSEIAGATDNDLVTTVGDTSTTTSANSEILVYDLATNTIKCNVATPAGNNTFGIDVNYVSAGSANNKFYVGGNAGQVYVYNDTCVLQQTIPLSFTGVTGLVRYVQYDGGFVFIQGTGATAPIVQMAVNSTGHILTTEKTTYLPQPSSSQSAFDAIATSITVGNMILFSGNGELWFPYTGDNAGDKKIGVLVYDTAPPDSPPTTGVNCDLPENANILICRVGGNGEIGSAGAFVIGNITQGTGILGIGCGIGIVDCTEDDNPQTNGLGLLIFIASLFVIVGMFFVSFGAERTWHMPVFLWVVIILALSAFFTITQLIDPVFLILTVVALIALASPKIMGVIRGSGSFGGGSTE